MGVSSAKGFGRIAAAVFIHFVNLSGLLSGSGMMGTLETMKMEGPKMQEMFFPDLPEPPRPSDALHTLALSSVTRADLAKVWFGQTAAGPTWRRTHLPRCSRRSWSATTRARCCALA